MKTLHDLRVGDRVTRVLAGTVRMPLVVTALDAHTVSCGDWTFDRTTGGEIDALLGWTAHATGSVIEIEPTRHLYKDTAPDGQAVAYCGRTVPVEQTGSATSRVVTKVDCLPCRRNFAAMLKALRER
jgi:hypothetical protein